MVRCAVSSFNFCLIYLLLWFILTIIINKYMLYVLAFFIFLIYINYALFISSVQMGDMDSTFAMWHRWKAQILPKLVILTAHPVPNFSINSLSLWNDYSRFVYRRSLLKAQNFGNRFYFRHQVNWTRKKTHSVGLLDVDILEQNGNR